jgi:hypothetical protein
MTANQSRASRFDSAVESYGINPPCENLIDLLTDAMHWCDRHDEDFHSALAVACCHYVHERHEFQPQGRSNLP